MKNISWFLDQIYLARFQRQIPFNIYSLGLSFECFDNLS